MPPIIYKITCKPILVNPYIDKSHIILTCPVRWELCSSNQASWDEELPRHRVPRPHRSPLQLQWAKLFAHQTAVLTGWVCDLTLFGRHVSLISHGCLNLSDVVCLAMKWVRTHVSVGNWSADIAMNVVHHFVLSELIFHSCLNRSQLSSLVCHIASYNKTFYLHSFLRFFE